MNDLDLQTLVHEHLQAGRMMQLATLAGDQPWVCTVFYVPDKHLNTYWISTPERRHSRELQDHSKVAATIPIKYTPGESVVGLQIEGEAEWVQDPDEIERAIGLYADRYGLDEKWRQDFVAGRNPHELYRLRPHLFVVFDEEKFPDDTRREWRPT